MRDIVKITYILFNRSDNDELRKNKCHKKSACYKTNNEHIPSFFIKHVGKGWNVTVESVDKPYIVIFTISRLTRHFKFIFPFPHSKIKIVALRFFAYATIDFKPPLNIFVAYELDY